MRKLYWSDAPPGKERLLAAAPFGTSGKRHAEIQLVSGKLFRTSFDCAV